MEVENCVVDFGNTIAEILKERKVYDTHFSLSFSLLDGALLTHLEHFDLFGSAILSSASEMKSYDNRHFNVEESCRKWLVKNRHFNFTSFAGPMPRSISIFSQRGTCVSSLTPLNSRHTIQYICPQTFNL